MTRASGNVLHELDGKSALALYKRYLGEHAAALPGSALFFPLSVSRTRDGPAVVRTVISIDEEAQTMTFGGDIPEGGYAQLMRANVDRLVDGALAAARATQEAGAQQPSLAMLISCAGRRLVLRQRVEDEIEAVREVLGPGTTMSGFYSYGEFAPSSRGTSLRAAQSNHDPGYPRRSVDGGGLPRAAAPTASQALRECRGRWSRCGRSSRR